jgi:hypothetical protein
LFDLFRFLIFHLDTFRHGVLLSMFGLLLSHRFSFRSPGRFHGTIDAWRLETHTGPVLAGPIRRPRIRRAFDGQQQGGGRCEGATVPVPAMICTGVSCTANRSRAQTAIFESIFMDVAASFNSSFYPNCPRTSRGSNRPNLVLE